MQGIRLLFVVLLGSVLSVSSCSKSADKAPATLATPSEFAISGVQNVTLGNSADSLTVTVSQTSGDKLPVSLYVEGLPEGITADIKKPVDSPTFSSLITFVQHKIMSGSSSAITVTGKSSAYTKSYPMTLTSSSLSDGVMWGGRVLTNGRMQHGYGAAGPYGFAVWYNWDSGKSAATVYGSINASAWPTASGIYTYPLQQEMNLTLSINEWGHTPVLYVVKSGTAVATITGSRLRVRVDSGIAVPDFGGTVPFMLNVAD
jgi:hypothetical protein